jgi:hypothetical protein
VDGQTPSHRAARGLVAFARCGERLLEPPEVLAELELCAFGDRCRRDDRRRCDRGDRGDLVTAIAVTLAAAPMPSATESRPEDSPAGYSRRWRTFWLAGIEVGRAELR